MVCCPHVGGRWGHRVRISTVPHPHPIGLRRRAWEEQWLHVQEQPVPIGLQLHHHERMTRRQLVVRTLRGGQCRCLRLATSTFGAGHGPWTLYHASCTLGTQQSELDVGDRGRWEAE